MEDSGENSGDLIVSAERVKVPRHVYEDFRPLVMQSVKIAEDILAIIEQVVGTPRDIIDHHLGKFRSRFRERVNETPVEFRQAPPLRIGCNVLKEVVFVAEEEGLQELFANLLGSCCDTRTVDIAHPGFAAVITQLTTSEAQLLKGMWDWIRQDELRSTMGEERYKDALPNLLRIGLIEYTYTNPSFYEPSRTAQQLAAAIQGAIKRRTSAERGYVPLYSVDGSTKQFAQAIARNIQLTTSPSGYRLSKFGLDFARVCLGPRKEKEPEPEPTTTIPPEPRSPQFAQGSGGFFA